MAAAAGIMMVPRVAGAAIAGEASKQQALHLLRHQVVSPRLSSALRQLLLQQRGLPLLLHWLREVHDRVLHLHRAELRLGQVNIGVGPH